MTQKNVLILNIDALRADHLTCMGYNRNITPNIDNLANDSIIFENAFSTSSWTRPSICSLFTGKYPSNHEMMIGAPFVKPVKSQFDSITIPQILQEFGYETYGIGFLDVIPFLFKKGFSRSLNILENRPVQILKNRNLNLNYIWSITRNIVYGYDKFAYYINGQIKKWINKCVKRRKPFFIFVNFLNAHSPWRAPIKFRKKFEYPSKSEKLQNLLGNASIKRRFKQMFIKLPWSYSKLIKYLSKRISLTNDEINILISRYDAEIAYLDTIIGKLIKFLKKNRIYDDTIIILTSDHGESFGEHHLLSHGFHLYDYLIHIPLIIKTLDNDSKRIKNLVSNIDIFPTILDFLEVKNEWDIDGISLMLNKNNFRNFIISELDWCAPKIVGSNYLKFFNKESTYYDYFLLLQPKQCIRTKNFKLIKYYNGLKELFDIQKDPIEQENIYEENKEIGKDLEKILNSTVKSLEKQREEDKIKRAVQNFNVKIKSI
ncbi:MAG: sulfatase family protein [Candidatus Helarchaeota archaeon]